MKKVYAIVSGSYSDYTVHCVFGDKQDADAHAEERGSYYGIEEMHFYPAGDVPEKVTWTEAQGKVGSMEVEATDKTEWPDGYDADRATSRPVVSYNPGSRWNGHVVYAHCADRDAAIKAVKDRLAALKASLIEVPFELPEESWRLVYPGVHVTTDALEGEYIVRGWDKERQVLYGEPCTPLVPTEGD